jgi:hypothetical protein
MPSHPRPPPCSPHFVRAAGHAALQKDQLFSRLRAKIFAFLAASPRIPRPVNSSSGGVHGEQIGRWPPRLSLYPGSTEFEVAWTVSYDASSISYFCPSV